MGYKIHVIRYTIEILRFLCSISDVTCILYVVISRLFKFWPCIKHIACSKYLWGRVISFGVFWATKDFPKPRVFGKFWPWVLEKSLSFWQISSKTSIFMRQNWPHNFDFSSLWTENAWVFGINVLSFWVFFAGGYVWETKLSF